MNIFHSAQFELGAALFCLVIVSVGAVMVWRRRWLWFVLAGAVVLAVLYIAGVFQSDSIA
jgi:predicted lysophospholipase L1 biosynthesis ABC-type transport system permease subunit